MRFCILILVVFLLVACGEKSRSPSPGYYKLFFQTENGFIPARLDISDSGAWRILNAEEIIQLDSVVFRNDSFFVKLPLFDTSLKGTWRNDSLLGEWTDHSRKQYSIPFVGLIETTEQCDNSVEGLQYEVLFSPHDSTSGGKGIAVLQKHGTLVVGTVLTETGDYRYLQGEINGDTLWLSAFDGTHLFYLRGTIFGDSITNGVFMSGKHWKESWVAVKKEHNSLRNPYDITTAHPEASPQLDVLNATGDSVRFDSSSWQQKVTILQIMGSWCPNCTDESRFLKTLFEEHAALGLQIIPVAFERGDDVAAACARVRKQFLQLGISYPFYYGGPANKESAHNTFPFLNGVHSFPTTVFIDRKGMIRKVFTGFYGPGTGNEYVKHTTSIRAFVDSLLAE